MLEFSVIVLSLQFFKEILRVYYCLLFYLDFLIFLLLLLHGATCISDDEQEIQFAKLLLDKDLQDLPPCILASRSYVRK